MEATEVKYFEKKIELSGEIDPDVTTGCSMNACEDMFAPSELTVYLDLKLSELEQFFKWANSNDVGKWMGKWRLTLEKLD